VELRFIPMRIGDTALVSTAGGHGLPKYLSSDHDPLYRSTSGKPIFGYLR
jgi:hypothetical protein